MTELELTDQKLIVTLTGWDRVWALKRRLEVPLASVRDAAPAPPPETRGWRKGARLPGTHLTGLVLAGTFRKGGQKTFYSVRRPDRAVAIALAGAPYDRLVLGVPDPASVAAAVRRAAGLPVEA